MGTIHENDYKIQEILACLSDTMTVAILKELIYEDKYSTQISRITSIANSTVTKKLNECEAAGLIASYLKTADVGRQVKKYRLFDMKFPFGTIKDYLISVSS